VRSVRLVMVAAVALALLGACGRSVGGSGNLAGPTGAATQDNGVAKLPPVQILTRAQAALAGASSVHIVGAWRSAGQQMALDLKVRGKDGARGTLVLPAGRGGNAVSLRIQLIIVGRTAYLQADRLLWVGVLGGSSAAADKLAGKWLKTSLDNAKVKPLLQIADPVQLSTGLIKPENNLARGTARQITGQPVIGVVDQGSTGSTIYVATTGPPVPVQIVETGADAAVINFTDYGGSVDLTPPAAADTVDGSTLGI
jgi:hypothetical protein